MWFELWNREERRGRGTGGSGEEEGTRAGQGLLVTVCRLCVGCVWVSGSGPCEVCLLAEGWCVVWVCVCVCVCVWCWVGGLHCNPILGPRNPQISQILKN